MQLSSNARCGKQSEFQLHENMTPPLVVETMVHNVRPPGGTYNNGNDRSN